MSARRHAQRLVALAALLAACTSETPPLPAITFDVTLPAETPAGASVVVTGDRPELPLVLVRDGLHATGAVGIVAGNTLAFELRLRDPGAVEADADGAPVPQHTLVVEGRGTTIQLNPAAWRFDGAATVSFVLHVPQTTPRSAVVHASGNLPALGEWDGAGLALQRADDGSWRGRVRNVPSGTRLEWKATRGSWATVEKARDGSELGNRAATAGVLDTTLEAVVERWADDPGEGTFTGDVRRIPEFVSEHVAPRDILVWLPPGYATETTRRYPVLYLHDGQNVFDANTAFGGVEWGADETAQRLVEAGEIEPVILVAVPNSAWRVDEYTPVYDPEIGQGGHAPEYARFLVEELKPFIDAAYRTRTDAASTGVAGSSLAGLVSMYLGLAHPETFTRLGVISPSVWWANREILGRVDALATKPPLKVWVDIGTAESDETVPDAEALRDHLVAKGFVPGDDLSFLIFSGAQHNEAAWAARFDRVLKFLFPPVR